MYYVLLIPGRPQPSGGERSALPLLLTLTNPEILERREIGLNPIRALKDCGDEGPIISDHRTTIIDLDLTHRLLGKEDVIRKILRPGIQDRTLPL